MASRRYRRLREQVLREGLVSTGVVLTSPSSIGRQEALAAAEGVRLNGLMRDLGELVGRLVAAELEAENFRPADYSRMPEISQRMRERIADRLTRGCPIFDEALADALGMRG